MAKKLTCIVTGRVLNIANGYYKTKLEKIGDEEKLHSTYICKEAKKLLRLGNSVDNVRKKLVDDELLPTLGHVEDELIHEIVFGNKKKFISSSNFDTLSTVTHNETDPEVVAFIKKIST